LASRPGTQPGLQGYRVGGLRLVLPDLGRVAGVLLDGQLAFGHDTEPLGAAGDGAVVGDQDQRQATFAPEGFQRGDDLVAGGFVEVAGGLVGQQHLGFIDQGPGDGVGARSTSGCPWQQMSQRAR
jgi:hypothetical protein